MTLAQAMTLELLKDPRGVPRELHEVFFRLQRRAHQNRLKEQLEKNYTRKME